MIDVFLRWWPETPVREELAQAVLERLMLFEGIHISVVYPMEIPRPAPRFYHPGLPWAIECLPERFHIQSKETAERFAKSDIYCVIDDDSLPIGKDFFARGAQTLANHPEYGMLSAWSPMDRSTAPAEEVIEAHAIGTPYFVRKGTLKEFPEGKKEQYDFILSKVVTDQGLKTGLMSKVVYCHAGHGLSQVIPDWWLA